MKYFKRQLKCPYCGSRDNQSFSFTKTDIDLINKTINVGVNCGEMHTTVRHYIGLTHNCGKPYSKIMKMTRAFYKSLTKEIKEI